MLVPNSHRVLEEGRAHRRQLQHDAQCNRLQATKIAPELAIHQRIRLRFAHLLIRAGEILKSNLEIADTDGRHGRYTTG